MRSPRPIDVARELLFFAVCIIVATMQRPSGPYRQGPPQVFRLLSAVRHSLKLVADGNAVCAQCHTTAKSMLRGSIPTMPRDRPALNVSPATYRCKPTCRSIGATGRAGKVEAAAPLLKLAASADAPSIARATAFESLADFPSPEAVAAAERGLADADPLIRLASLRALRALPVEQSWPLARGLLTDPVRGAGIEAASLLAPMPQDRLPLADRERLWRAIDEYVKAQRVNADRPEHRLNIGNLYLQLTAAPVRRSRGGIHCGPRPRSWLHPGLCQSCPALCPTAQGPQGERVLRQALSRMPINAELHHALGLNLVRQRRAADALPELARAAEIDPGSARYAYAYAIGPRHVE